MHHSDIYVTPAIFYFLIPPTPLCPVRHGGSEIQERLVPGLNYTQRWTRVGFYSIQTPILFNIILLITSVKRRPFLILLGSLLQRALGETKLRSFLILLLCQTYPFLHQAPRETKLDGSCLALIPTFLRLLLLCWRKICAWGVTLLPGDRRREGDTRSQGVEVTTDVRLYTTIQRLKNSCPIF